jgi:lysophospholipase L1-like esterase
MNRFGAGPVYCGANVDAACEVRDGADLPALLSAAKPGFRLLFIGSSQTIGAGAENVRETFFARTHQILSADLAPVPLESLNASVSGATAEYLLEEYRKQYIQFRPDLVVIDLGNNDPADGFGKGLAGFLEENKRAGIQTILLEEANSFEAARFDNLRRNHETMERLAVEYRVPVYPLHNFLNQPDVRDTGFIWWDIVHLTSYGQAVVSQWLAPRIRIAFDRLPRNATGKPEHLDGGAQ